MIDNSFDMQSNNHARGKQELKFFVSLLSLLENEIQAIIIS